MPTSARCVQRFNLVPHPLEATYPAAAAIAAALLLATALPADDEALAAAEVALVALVVAVVVVVDEAPRGRASRLRATLRDHIVHAKRRLRSCTATR